ncbi:MAG: hypothetical protein QW165_04100 [Candidatus Woesearchaeota archaeon]
MWCGRRLCEFCIAKREGIKLYCDKCSVQLGGIRRERLPRLDVQPRPPATGRRFVLRNGYLEQEGGE